MSIMIANILGTLALTGILRAIMLYLLKKFDHRTHWVAANFAAAFLRAVFAVPGLWGNPYILLNVAVLFGIYVLEQLVWFAYDYIQQRRGFVPAGWGLIFGVIVGGVLWMLVLRMLTFYISSGISAA